MGLDMCAYKIKSDLVQDKQVDVSLVTLAKEAVGYVSYETSDIFDDYSQEALDKAKEENIIDTDFWYWRKFNHLHGWMKRLYQAKGGTNEDFNCSSVRLTAEDLKQLYKDIKDNKLVSEKGFFFGSDKLYPGDVIHTLEFIDTSLDVLQKGRYAIFYIAWW